LDGVEYRLGRGLSVADPLQSAVSNAFLRGGAGFRRTAFGKIKKPPLRARASGLAAQGAEKT